MMDQEVHVGKELSAEAIRQFCKGKSHLALVTDGAAYSLCGAEAFINDVLTPQFVTVQHLVVPSANPNVETVQPLLDSITSEVDGFIAVGGGSTIDTAKLLNLAIVSGAPIKTILTKKEAPEKLKPYLAIPTTAGTGAEATRFAVCYEGETKYSIDFLCIRPSEVALVPDFIATLPPYQKASTNFDAYAQAVESLWANGATPESREFSLKALQLMCCRVQEESRDASEGLRSPSEGIRCIHRGFPEEELRNRSEEDCLLAQLQASYYAGRAIDISRTTAAHAFSYYLTSHYGIPHGHAVFMVFPYILRNNAEVLEKLNVEGLSIASIEADLGRFHKLGLKTLKEFSAEKGIAWSDLVDELFAHVNLKRLGNNPVEVRKESFNG